MMQACDQCNVTADTAQPAPMSPDPSLRGVGSGHETRGRM